MVRRNATNVKVLMARRGAVMVDYETILRTMVRKECLRLSSSKGPRWWGMKTQWHSGHRTLPQSSHTVE